MARFVCSRIGRREKRCASFVDAAMEYAEDEDEEYKQNSVEGESSNKNNNNNNNDDGAGKGGANMYWSSSRPTEDFRRSTESGKLSESIIVNTAAVSFALTFLPPNIISSRQCHVCQCQILQPAHR